MFENLIEKTCVKPKYVTITFENLVEKLVKNLFMNGKRVFENKLFHKKYYTFYVNKRLIKLKKKHFEHYQYLATPKGEKIVVKLV
jgi:hypothetical protein